MKAVLFDAFGTLVEIMDKRNPYARALKNSEIANMPLVHGRGCMLWPIPLETLTRDPALLADLDAELASIEVYPDVIPTLTRLRGEGVKTAIVSNIAAPYAEVVTRLLGEHVDELIYSCWEGHIKPNPSIFQLACQRLGVEVSDTTMIGDNYKNDFKGAELCGLNAAMILRQEGDILDALL
jgi:HAD superfamily hydrolase (TIGR01549 family)